MTNLLIGYLLAGWTFGVWQHGARCGFGISWRSVASAVEVFLALFFWPFVLVFLAVMVGTHGPPSEDDLRAFYENEDDEGDP